MILYIVSSAAIACLCLATWAYFESEKAAKSAVVALQKEELANLSALEAETEKRNASRSAREAAVQAKIALQKEEEAKKASETAAIKAEEARVAANKAKIAAIEAEKQKEEAVRQGKIAEKEKAIAKTKAEEAAIAEAAALKAEALAQKLKLQSLAEAIAIKSKRIENKPETQGQIAKKAVEIFQKSDGKNPIAENEIFNPAIYEGVYFGIKAIKKSNGEKTFNEFIANDKHRGTIYAIVKGDDAFYTAGSDGKILKWDVTASKAVDKPQVLVSAVGKRSETILAMAVAGNTLVTGGKDRKLAIYTLGGSSTPIEVDVHNSRFIWNVAFAGTRKDKIVSTGQDRKVYLTDLTVARNGGKSTLLFSSPTNIKVLDVHINGRNVVLGATNGRISVIDINSPNKEVRSKVINANISAIKYSPNGSYIVAADVNGKVYIYDNELRQIGDYEAHNLAVTDIEFNGNRGFVTTSRDKTAKYWMMQKLTEGEKNYEPFILNDHSDWCTAANFSGKQAVVGCKDGSLKFWALDVGTLSKELCGLLKDKKIKRKDWDKYIGEDAALEKTVGTSTCQ
jgi:pSer/pThr/pTyr-binding forkhead associated (FHA) protein